MYEGTAMITESELERIALTWFQDCGWEYRHGPDLAPDGEMPERTDYRQVLLRGRALDAMRRINLGVPESLLDDVLHRFAKAEHPSLILNNRVFHEALLEG